MTFPPGTATVPTSYSRPTLLLDPRAGGERAARIHPRAGGGVPLAFDLAHDNGDSELVYIIPRAAHTGRRAPASTIIVDAGLPDAFGRPLDRPPAA